MRCTEVYYSKPGMDCQSCGTPIHNCFVVETDEGGSITVGSECAHTLVGDTTVAQYERYAAKAARQWRAAAKGDKAAPAPREGEARDAYITRRIREMTHARRAWQVWRSLCGGADSRSAAGRRLEARGVRNPWDARYAHRRIHFEPDDGCAICLAITGEMAAWPRLVAGEEAAMLREVERKYDANRVDFVGVPGWRI